MSVSSKVEKITPDVAVKIIEESKDIRNRTVNQGHVAWLVQQMRTGKWVLNGEAIILDDEGQVIDGQHRLWAVIESGITIESLVTRGVDRKGFATIDTGAARTLGNVLGIVGEKYAAAVAAALGWIHRHDQGRMFTSTKAAGFSHQIGLALVKKYPEIRDSAEFIHKLTKNPILKRVPPSALIFLHHRFALHAKDKATEFFETLGDLRFDTEGTPTRTLRNQILHVEKQLNDRRPVLVTMAYFVKAWSDFLGGKMVQRGYQWRRSGEYPEDFPKFPGERESAGKAMKIVRRTTKRGDKTA